MTVKELDAAKTEIDAAVKKTDEFITSYLIKGNRKLVRKNKEGHLLKQYFKRLTH